MVTWQIYKYPLKKIVSSEGNRGRENDHEYNKLATSDHCIPQNQNLQTWFAFQTVMICRYLWETYFQHRKIKTNTEEQIHTKQRKIEHMKIAIIW